MTMLTRSQKKDLLLTMCIFVLLALLALTDEDVDHTPINLTAEDCAHASC